jgi:lipopolysaccharide biosynthesis protein
MRGTKYKINYLQEMKKYEKRQNETKLQEQENTVIFNARSYTSKFQLIPFVLRLLHTMNVRFSLLDIAQRILGVTLPNFQ